MSVSVEVSELSPTQPGTPSGRFRTTCWTQVLSARGDSSESREALSELCEHYYEPVLAYLRRAGENREGEARDLAHDFFADLLQGHRLDRLEREKGRFRSYLLGALKHFLSHHRSRQRAQKRGGDAGPSFSLNETGVELREGQALEDMKAMPPDTWFDRQWAVTLLDRALALVESECEAEGNATEFQHLSPWLTGEAEHGDQSALADRIGISPNTLKSTIHRLRRRFRHAVKAEIARTLSDSSDVETEMAALFAALGGEGKD
jgi:RNA polymerase sigma-70 factor (ECF subfamily)